MNLTVCLLKEKEEKENTFKQERTFHFQLHCMRVPKAVNAIKSEKKIAASMPKAME